VLFFIVYLIYSGLFRSTKKNTPPNLANYRLIVSKRDLKLELFDKNDYIKSYRVSTGKNSGDKQKVGDCRTPVGSFRIISIEKSDKWAYDFENDDLGPIVGAYGPYFLRLDTPWKGIGIHGTHNNDSLGIYDTHGCVRVKNSELRDLMQYVTINTQVDIVE